MDKQFGVGLELPFEIANTEGVDDLISQLPLIELIPESFFFGKKASFLETLQRSNVPVVIHSVEMSVGSVGEFHQSHLDKIKDVMNQVNTVFYSDHLCFTKYNGIEMGQLTTLPWTDNVFNGVCENISRIQDQVQVPFLIENITNRFIVPNCPYSETEFINKVLEKTGCKMIMDLANTYINSVNFGFDPYKWIDEINLGSVEGVHLAGGSEEDGVLYDSHGSNIPKPVWDLYEYLVTKKKPQFTIVERDQNIPTFNELIHEVNIANNILNQSDITIYPNALNQMKSGVSVV